MSDLSNRTEFIDMRSKCLHVINTLELGAGVQTLCGADRKYRLTSTASGFTGGSDIHRLTVTTAGNGFSEPSTMNMVAVPAPGGSRSQRGGSGGGTLRA